MELDLGQGVKVLVTEQTDDYLYEVSVGGQDILKFLMGYLEVDGNVLANIIQRSIIGDLTGGGEEDEVYH